MFGTYLRRELVNRRKQTVIIAIGLALAIALVIVVNSVSAGVSAAQASVLRSVYGVGTDVTVTTPATAPTASASGPGGGNRFDFGAQDGASDSAGTSREIHQSRLESERGTTTMTASALSKARSVTKVASAAAVLALTNTTFDGTLPTFTRGQRPGAGGAPTTPSGGADGAGGSAFTVDSFSVLGIDPGGTAVGPLTAAALSVGRSFAASDTGADVAVLDAAYAKTASIDVGDSLTIGSTAFRVIGLVKATGSDATTASNVYIPLDVAQKLSGNTGKISTIYVKAASAGDIAEVKAGLQKALPDATVSTQADLASSVSGSLGSAASLVANLGTWLSLIVLAAAFLVAILFTISGVSRRTREFGTLKAIGWSNRRIVGQVAGESVVQSLIGGAVGVIVGLIGIVIVNMVAPTLSGSVGSGVAEAAGRAGRAAIGATSGAGRTGGFGGPGGAFGGFAAAREGAASATNVVLQAPVTVWIIVIAVGLAVIGGLLAGAFGGWRAARLRPAAALRSVA